MDYLQEDYFSCEFFRSLALSALKQPVQALEAIKRAEALYLPEWKNEPARAIELDEMYMYYHYYAGDYDKALEYVQRVINACEDDGWDQAVLLMEVYKASALFKKGDYKAAAEIYRKNIDRNREINKSKVFAQLNELRTLYELDKAEMESERRMEALRRQRLINTGLAFSCLALTLIVGLTVWSRKKIAEKNRGLYHQIKEQDRLADELRKAGMWNEASSLHYDEDVDEQQRKLFEHMQERLKRERYFANPDTDTDKLVKELNTNRTYLYKAVNVITGKSVQDYLNSMRLEEARRLLDTTDELIETVAKMSGYNTVRTFYRLYREKYNMTPADYRKMKKKEEAANFANEHK
jgi:AraC-like DNA-binding protein